MKLVVFILALVAGAMSMVVVNQVKKEEASATPMLVANIGMDYREVKRRSSVAMGDGIYYAGEKTSDMRYREFIDDNEFDWEVAGTGLRFPKCKYFRVQTGYHDDPRVVFMWVTTAQKKLTYAELKAEMLAIQERILADGWKPTYRGKDDLASDVQLKQELEQAKPDSSGTYGAGVSYVKDDTVLIFIGTQLYTDPLIVKDPMRQDIFYHRIELKPRGEWEKGWQGGRYTRP